MGALSHRGADKESTHPKVHFHDAFHPSILEWIDPSDIGYLYLKACGYLEVFFSLLTKTGATLQLKRFMMTNSTI